MTTAKNEHTGDLIKSKAPSKQYEDNHERIFGKNKDKPEKETNDTKQ